MARRGAPVRDAAFYSIIPTGAYNFLPHNYSSYLGKLMIFHTVILPIAIFMSRWVIHCSLVRRRMECDGGGAAVMNGGAQWRSDAPRSPRCATFVCNTGAPLRQQFTAGGAAVFVSCHPIQPGLPSFNIAWRPYREPAHTNTAIRP